MFLYVGVNLHSLSEIIIGQKLGSIELGERAARKPSFLQIFFLMASFAATLALVIIISNESKKQLKQVLRRRAQAVVESDSDEEDTPRDEIFDTETHF